MDPTLFTGVMARLIEGALAFRRNEYQSGRTAMPRLAAGQHPEILMIGCSDSRVDPALICGAGPGDVFTIRNVANLVPAYEAGDGRGYGVRAALEYGVKVLGVSHVVVFGHSHCGGVGAMIDAALGAAPEFEFIGPWLAIADTVPGQALADLAADGRPEVTADALHDCAAVVERRSILNSMSNLHTYPWIRERIAAGTLTVHGWWFDLDSGDLWATHPETGAFMPVEGDRDGRERIERIRGG